MSDSTDYYNFKNLREFLNKLGVVYPEDWLRWAKDILGTKISMFYYDGLPEKLTSQIAEQALCFNNFLCLYNSKQYGVVLCQWRMGSTFDLYWKPVTVDLLSLSGKTIATNVPYEDIVLVRDNILDIPPMITLNGWIQKILDIERTLSNQMILARFPTILVGDKEQANMLKNLLKSAINSNGFVIASKNFKDHLEQFDIKYPVQPTDVYELMEKYKNLALASIGIYSVDQKRERIVTAEVNATNDYVDFVYTGMYRERQRWVEEANSKFGTNIVLHETYVDNQQDDIKLDKEKAMAQADADIKVEKVKNEGKVEAAKEQAKGYEKKGGEA